MLPGWFLWRIGLVLSRPTSLKISIAFRLPRSHSLVKPGEFCRFLAGSPGFYKFPQGNGATNEYTTHLAAFTLIPGVWKNPVKYYCNPKRYRQLAMRGRVRAVFPAFCRVTPRGGKKRSKSGVKRPSFLISLTLHHVTIVPLGFGTPG